jgi:hypothetical protein
MKVRIEIDTKTFVRFWLVVMGFGLAGLAIYSAKDALVLLGISLFLALPFVTLQVAASGHGNSPLDSTGYIFISC